jgi:glycosyltransferase involved in cell wall biosynthesis
MQTQLPRAGRSVLLAVAEFPPIGGGGVIRMTKLSRYLDELGWSLTVVTSDEPLAHAVDVTLLDELPDRIRIDKVRPPLHRVSRAVTTGTKQRVARRTPLFGVLHSLRQAFRSAFAIPDRWLPWSLSVGRRYLPAETPDALISSGPPHSVHIGASMLARRHRIPHVIDLRDEWSLRPLMRSRIPWRIAAEMHLERWCLRRADAIVLVSDESRQRYAAAYREIAERFIVVPNGFDPEDIRSIVRTRPEAGSDLMLGYAGSFQVGTDVQPMLAAIGDVTRSGFGDRAVRFELAGPLLPEELDAVRASIPARALRLHGMVPHRDALQLMAGWDVLFVVATDGRASLAGKIYECLALRKPIVVVAPEGPARRLVTELRAGTVGDPTDDASIRAAIMGALSMAGPDFAGASEAALAPYDRREQAKRWAQLLDSLIERSITPVAARQSQP